MVPNSYPQFGVLVVWNEEKKVSVKNINVIPIDKHSKHASFYAYFW